MASARLLAFAWLFALCAVGLQLTVHHAFSAFAASARYDLGALLALGAHLLAGLVLGLPLLLASPARSARVRLFARTCSTALAAFAFGLLAIAYHYHALFARLPTLVTLGALHGGGSSKLAVSLAAALPPWAFALELLVPSALLFTLIDPLARVLAAPTASTTTTARSAFPRTAAWSLLTLLALVALLAPRRLQGQAYYGAVHPLVHMLAASEPVTVPAKAIRETQALVLARQLRARLGVPERAPADPAYPYCSAALTHAAPAPSLATAPPPSVLVILLEGISNRELTDRYQGKPLMPKLAALLHEGLSFQRFEAAGDRSSQALFSLLAGVPPETHRRVITHSHLVAFQGIPRALHDRGFDTWYFHGSDLSFEQQRALLQRAGFARIVEPDPRSLARTTGWGLPDRVVLGQLMHDVDARRQLNPPGNAPGASEQHPLFALVATLSTHDPYVPPPDYQRIFTGDDRYSRFADTARYLDDELARLYAWYLRNEKPRGTVLAILSDHVPRVPAPSDPADTSTGEFEYRFDVPFALFGNAIDTLPAADKQRFAMRLGSHDDVGVTLLSLAGSAPPPCALGRDLLARDWPAQRWAVSIAGDDLEYLFVHDPPLRWMMPLDGRKPTLFDLDADPQLRRDLFTTKDPRWRDVRALVDAYLKLGAYLNVGDHFAPPAKPGSTSTAARPPRAAAPKEPLRIISHRGNTQGAQASSADKADENSFAAIDRALAAGFAWVEIDVQVTDDHVPIICHDPSVRAPDGSEITLAKVTFAELRARKLANLPTLSELLAHYAGRAHFAVELKPQATWQDDMALARVALQAIDARPKGMRIVVDSFSEALTSTIHRWSDVEVGWDLPQKQATHDWINLARDRQLDWVYARHDLITPADVSALHAGGVRVMLYTLDDPSALAKFGADPPDGVITDSAAWLAPAGK